MEPIIKNEIRLDLVFGVIKESWRKILVAVVVTVAVTIALVLCVPRYYVAKVMLAPEYGENQMGGGALSAAASILDINMSGSGVDAIMPEFYPDIVESTDFLVPVLESGVETQDGGFKGSYGEYIMKCEKSPWWATLIGMVKGIFVSSSEPYNADDEYKIDPFRLTSGEYNLLQRVSASIGCSVDEKTGVITLTLKAQDPYVAANMANVVKNELQSFMTKYRTGKNKNELMHSTAMCDTAYVNYVKAQAIYADYVDKHQGLAKKAYQVEEERLASEMQLAFNIYSTLCQQKLLNESEVQKRTPVFTVLQNATVPVKPAGPKRMLITLFMAIVSALVCVVIQVYKKYNGTENTASE